MEPESFIRQAERDAKVIDALFVARYSLVTHHSLTVHCEGFQWQMDFKAQIDEIDEVLRLLGIDTTEQMLAPVRRLR